MKRIGRRGLLQSVPVLAAPAFAASERERVLRFMPQVDLVTLDPHFSMTNVTRNHGGLVFDQLYGTDSASQAQPQMAEGHTIEDGGKRCVSDCARVCGFTMASPCWPAIVPPVSAAGAAAMYSARNCYE